jgi:hypothetical protein
MVLFFEDTLMEPFTTPNKLLNHMRNLYIDTRQDTTHGQVTYIVGSLKFIGLIHIAETITNRFSQFETKPIFNPFLSGVKTDFELASKDHPAFLSAFARYLGCGDAASMLEVYYPVRKNQ